eukprot:g829.t1
MTKVLRNLSLRSYYERYADTQTPVIIEDYAHAFEGMSRANMVAVCGKKTASVARRVQRKGAWAGIEWKSAGPLEEVMQDPSLGESGGKFDPKAGMTTGIFDWSLSINCPRLLEEHFVYPKYFAQSYLERLPAGSKSFYRDAWPSLFVGAAGTFGALHRDVFGSAFWQYVIEGKKEWHIINSIDGRDFYEGGGGGTDAFGGSTGRGVAHYHDLVGPGELLIIPGHCWHQVRNVGATLSLAGNYVSRGNLGTMEFEVRQGIQKSNPAYYRQVLPILEPGFNTTIDFAAADMPWPEYKDQARRFPSHKPGRKGERGGQAALEAVVVSGAGSDAVNGRYTPAGRYLGAVQYALRKGGRTFELFRVDAGSGWWNILEKNAGAPVHYGVREKGTAALDPLPPTRGWSSKFNPKWIGAAPMPTVTLAPSVQGAKDEL